MGQGGGMSSKRAAKVARRAKRQAKDAARAARPRQYRCVDCGQGPLYRGGIEIGGRDGERHYCKACMPPERLIAYWRARGQQVNDVRAAQIAADWAAIPEGPEDEPRPL
jgi:hypothetical protein